MIKETLRVWRKNGIKPALKSAKKSLDSKKNAKRNLELYNVTHKLNANQEEIDLALRKLRENYVIFKSRMVKCHEQFERITSLAIIENNEPALLYTDEFTNGSFIFKPDFSPETLEAYNYMGNCIVVKRDCLDNKREYQSLEIVEPDAIEDIARHAANHGETVCHIPKALFVDYQGNTTLCNKKEKEDEFGELPKLSIIIPNCDHVSDLKRLIDSILNIEKYHEYEIIVVENNSKNKETFEYYEKLRTGVYNSFGCKKIKIIKWEGRFNYSAINNFAVKQAEGELILLLNNDTQFIEPLSLRYMAGYAKRENIGAVGACLLYGNDTIQHAGVVVGIGPDKTAVHLNAGEPFDSEEYRDVIHHNRNYSAVTGACLMVKKSEYEKVGGLDENFAVAYNDIDFCLRLIENGLRNVYVSDALLYHFESKSRGSDKKGEKYQRFMREAELFRNKWSRYIKQGDPYYNVNMKKGDDSFADI